MENSSSRYCINCASKFDPYSKSIRRFRLFSTLFRAVLVCSLALLLPGLHPSQVFAGSANSAPTLTTTDFNLPNIAEDVAPGSNSGQLISAILGSNAADSDGNPIGVAVVDRDDDNGTWEFFDGSIWWNLDQNGPRSESNAKLLPPSARLRFDSATDFTGTATLTFHAWDGTQGSGFGEFDILSNGSGGSTAFSAEVGTLTVTVDPVNDAAKISCGESVPALALDGAGDYVDLPDFPATFNGDFTVESWANVTGYATWSRLVDFANGPAADNLVVGYYAGSNQPALQTFPGAHTLGPSSQPTDTWFHLAVVADGAGNEYMYINGQLVASGPGHSILQAVVRTSNFIGKSNWDQDSYFNGLYREIRVWNTARTGAEIQANMDGALNGDEPGLLAYYPASDLGAPTLQDYGPNHYDGTLVNDAQLVKYTAPECSRKVNEDLVNPVKDVTISDVDAGSADVVMTLSVSHGILAVDSGAAGGLAGGQINGNGTPSLMLSGSVSEINATLASANGFTYRGELNYNGPDTIMIGVDDQGASGSGGAQVAANSISLTVKPVNDTPTDLSLSGASVPENQPAGTSVGTLTTTDVDGSAFTYSLPLGIADNDAFQLAGDQLQTSASFDFETRSSYTITTRSTDEGGLYFEKQITITVTNVLDFAFYYFPWFLNQ